jgi:hypothetical protein
MIEILIHDAPAEREGVSTRILSSRFETKSYRFRRSEIDYASNQGRASFGIVQIHQSCRIGKIQCNLGTDAQILPWASCSTIVAFASSSLACTFVR